MGVRDPCLRPLGTESAGQLGDRRSEADVSGGAGDGAGSDGEDLDESEFDDELGSH